ncbi:MAG: hypothetical protein KDM91_18260 [Verrucomicrobiae bacterium]|nr:hypothetical protein [Verrucomicrobiae bacterium]MCP5540508.1 hypothetical protein [Akkermansiaceae bacterium]
MSKHTQSILFFGIIFPGIVIGILFAGVFVGRSKLEVRKVAKEKVFKAYQEAASAKSEVEQALGTEGRLDQMAYFDEQISQEFIQALTKNLNEVTSNFNETQLLRTELSRPGGRSSFAGYTENQYSRFKLSFEGGFGPMQMTLAELEMRMPHLVLESLKMGPGSGNGSSLKFDATYVCWLEPDGSQRKK